MALSQGALAVAPRATTGPFFKQRAAAIQSAGTGAGPGARRGRGRRAAVTVAAGSDASATTAPFLQVQVTLERPLGFVIEVLPGGKGTVVTELVPRGHAEQSGSVKVGDLLLACATPGQPLVDATEEDLDGAYELLSVRTFHLAVSARISVALALHRLHCDAPHRLPLYPPRLTQDVSFLCIQYLCFALPSSFFALRSPLFALQAAPNAKSMTLRLSRAADLPPGQIDVELERPLGFIVQPRTGGGASQSERVGAVARWLKRSSTGATLSDNLRLCLICASV